MPDIEGLFGSIRRLSAQLPVSGDQETQLWNRFGTRCAMLVLDSSGFTQSTQQSGIIGFLQRILRMRDTIESILPGFDCISSRAAADNFYAEFNSADHALEAALEIRRILREPGTGSRDVAGLGVCIGIGYGDVLRSISEGMFGNEMNLASKLGEDLAGEGDILLTESAFQAISEKHSRNFNKRNTTVSGVELSYYSYEFGQSSTSEIGE